MTAASGPLRLVCLSADEELRRELENALAPFEGAAALRATDPADPDLSLLAEADALVCGSLPGPLQTAAPALRWIQFWSADGQDTLRPELFEGGVQVASAAGIHASACAEHVLALLLAFARALPATLAAQQARDWSRRAAICDALFELEGKTVGIVGAGRVGQGVGVRCQAFGMRTVGLRRDVSRTTRGIDVLLPHLRYHDLLLASDFVVLALPLTPETQMIFGEDEIEILKKSAYVLNIGRGGLIDEPRLLQALKNRWIAGAGLDRFVDEPLPPESPFWTLPNCIVTPHVGGCTPHYWRRFARLVADQVERWLSGRLLGHLVDPAPGR